MQKGELMPLNSWERRHNLAMRYPRPEEAVGTLLKAWKVYALNHLKTYATKIGNDYVLGPPWAAIGESLRTLLNGELGGLDAGTLDRDIIHTLENHGFVLDDAGDILPEK